MGSGRGDVIITGAAVHAMDAPRRRAEAIAVSGGVVTAVGPRAEVLQQAAPGARTVALDGCMVLPAFQDAHCHPLHGGMAEIRCGLHDAFGLAEYAKVISGYARDHPDAEWVLGSGWAMDAFAGGTPTAAELDEIVGERPAFLVNRDGHGAWVNTAALRRAGISSATADPRDGRIERDEHGEPTGTLHEGAMRLVESLVPSTTAGERVRALRAAQARMHSLGVTAWQDAWIEPDDLSAYRSVSDAGDLTARVVLSLLWDRSRGEEQLGDLTELRSLGATGRMRANTVKIFQDGVAENFTAGMLQPYLDASGRSTDNRGLSMVEPQALRRYVELLDAEGFQVHFHAIGDRAVREALDALEAARKGNGVRDSRHHIAHIQVVDPRDIARFRTLGVVANAQPFWAYLDGQMRDLTLPFLGPERSALQYPFATLRRAGAPMAFGSDWPVSTCDPLLELEVAVTRADPKARASEVFLPEERLDVPAALEAGTIGSAYVNHLDGHTGTLEPGKRADVVVVDRDLFGIDGGYLSDAQVVATLVDGEPVYDPSGVF